MSIVSLASMNSVWRGYEYWRDKKVVSFTKNSDENYSGVVSGSKGERYQVTIDLAHPRRSSCTCPHAAGRQIICKHKIALYFTAFPDEGKVYEADYNAAIEELKRIEEEDAALDDLVVQAIKRMTKSELRQALCELLFDGPEWQFDHFIEEYVD